MLPQTSSIKDAKKSSIHMSIRRLIFAGALRDVRKDKKEAIRKLLKFFLQKWNNTCLPLQSCLSRKAIM